MLTTFGLRLAGGMMGSLLVLPAAGIQPRFFRVHCWVALALGALAALFCPTPSLLLAVILVVALGGAALGSVAWSLEGAPGGRVLVGLSCLGFAAAMVMAALDSREGEASAGAPLGWAFADDLSAAALLGTSMTAMLVGHSYLISPTMSLSPLLRMLGALFAALAVRLVVVAAALAAWSVGHSFANLSGAAVWWLPVRWTLGLAGPAVLGVLAWRTTRIRSTQSATGILYVVVILCFLGELTSQLLRGDHGLLL